MLSYIIRRLLWTIPVLLVASSLAFFLVKALPSEPFQNPRLSPTLRANLERVYGFDKPWYEQYVDYVARTAQFELGNSVRPGYVPVKELIFETLPTSMFLGTSAFVMALVVGTVLGALSALFVNRWPDGLILLISTAAFAVPLFIVCVYWVEYLPYRWDHGWEKIGPISVLALALLPYFTRLVRAAMLETLQADFVTAARSKGLPWGKTVVRHVLRNSLIPMVTNAGPLFGFVLTGSFLVEYIMAVPGMAYLFVLSFRDVPDTFVVLNLTVLLSVIIIGVNLIVDVVVSFLDPRISHD